MDSQLEHGYGRPEYVPMSDIRQPRGETRAKGRDEFGYDDEEHILKAGSGSVKTGTGSEEDAQGQWITKTVEFTVNDMNSERGVAR